MQGHAFSTSSIKPGNGHLYLRGMNCGSKNKDYAELELRALLT